MFYEGKEGESKKLAFNFSLFSKTVNASFLDANEFVKPNDSDGIHLSKESNKILGIKVAKAVKKMINV